MAGKIHWVSAASSTEHALLVMNTHNVLVSGQEILAENQIV